MKYPQLVSTKAVSEISDWLIKRLEDLDIEHPQVYSRYLLSLLHTPLKVNAIDLEELKQPHHRLLNKNNEELKRLTAVESLLELSVEENKTSIVDLVDELYLKLRKLENEEMNNRGAAVVSSSPNSTTSKLHKNLKKIKRNHGTENPTKNYYLVFPALNSNKMASSSSSKSSTITSAAAAAIASENQQAEKDPNMNLPWSKLMTTSKTPSAVAIQREKTPQQQRRKQKRYEKGFAGSKRMQKEVQSYNLHDNSTFSPKKMQMVKSNNNNKKPKHQRNNNNNHDSSAKKIINNNTKHYNDIRNNYLSNFGQNAPPKLDGTALGPWDMDFKGHWEMDRDLIGEFIQQQNHDDVCSSSSSGGGDGVKKFMMPPTSVDDKKMKLCANKVVIVDEDEDDKMLMKCLPMKLIDDSFHDESDWYHDVRKVYSNKEAASISSLTSKFDENVKAIWCDGNEPMKPLTHKAYGGSNGSLASSFMSDKNSLSLFNFNEPPPIPVHSASSSLQYFQQHQQYNMQQPQQIKKFSECIAPPMKTKMNDGAYLIPYSTCKQQQQIDYDYNNNNNNNDNHKFFNGVRGVISNCDSFGSSPYKQQQQDNFFGKTDFIKSGTNLTSSIWSDGGFTSDSECLILKNKVVNGSDVVDEARKLISMAANAQIKAWDNSTDNEESDSDDEEVTLINHAAEQSAFKKYKPLIAPKTIVRAGYHPLNAAPIISPTSSSQDTAAAAATTEQENLLTSEKTHFSPIIRDGHTFPIDDNWDEIPYERTESGGLFYKNKRYQVAKKPDNMFFNDALDLSAMEDYRDGGDFDAEGFTVKFMINSENDKGCQTEDTEILLMGRTYLEINEEYCRRKMYDEYFKGAASETNNKWRLQNNNDDDEFNNNHSFFTKNGVHPIVLPKLVQEMLGMEPASSSSSSICTMTSNYDAAGSVEDPFESWRNLNADQDHKHNCGHGLWEECIACARNNEDLFIEKPVPANRLLKDELQLDGDEIMNVIQNLYITSDFCDDEEDKDDDCDGFDMNHVIDMIAMDDSMDGIEEEEEEEHEVENKFYDEQEIAVKNQKNILTLKDLDDVALAKMQNAMGAEQENCIKLFEWIQSTLTATSGDGEENKPADENIETAKASAEIVADTNNNECLNVSEVQQPTNNRKRRHSTCQNLLQKRRFDSQEPGFTYQLNFKAGTAPAYDFDAVKNFFLDAANVLNINIENVLLITNPTSMEMASYHHEQDQGENYYRNILQQQHALVKNLELSRPLTR